MTALLLAAAFACGAALPAMAEQATPETAAQPDPTEWADEAQDVTEAEEAPVYQQADAQEVATGETAASLTVTAADCTAQFIDEAYRLFLPSIRTWQLLRLKLVPSWPPRMQRD